MSHPCRWNEGGRCVHPDRAYGERPSAGVCMRVCQVYEGPDRGLGDTVARLTEVTGIKRVVERAAKAMGKDCGCGRRRAALNGALPFGVLNEKKEGEMDDSIGAE